MSHYSVDILNTIRNEASTTYSEIVPQATQDNITAVGNAITSYSTTQNEFVELLGKIALTLIDSDMADNPLAIFKMGMLPYGKDIEEIHVEMAEAEGAFDPEGSNPLGRRKSEIDVIYHRENRRDKFVVSVSDEQIKDAFTSSSGVNDLVNKMIESIHSGEAHTEYVVMKELLAKYEDNYYNYHVPEFDTATETQVFLRSLRKAVTDLSFMSKKYNKAGITTRTTKDRQVLLVHKDVIAHTDVDVLAKSFNMGKTDMEPTITVVDDFGSMEDTIALLVDRRFFRVWDTLMKSERQRNSDGLFDNIFLHKWQVLSLSLFKNAVRFTTEDEPQ